jgi:hypothetical protein
MAADGIRILSMIARHPDFPPEIKRRAQAELNALRQEGLDKVIQ